MAHPIYYWILGTIVLVLQLSIINQRYLRFVHPVVLSVLLTLSIFSLVVVFLYFATRNRRNDN